MILPPVPAIVWAQEVELQNKLISIDFEQTPLRTALEALFKSAGISNYSIDKTISGTVSIKSPGLPFAVALQSTIRESMEPVTYFKENNVWVVKRLPQAIGTQDSANVVYTPFETPARPISKWTTIPVRYRTVSELAPLLGGIATMGRPLPELKMVPNPNFSPDPYSQRARSDMSSRAMIPVRSLLPPGIDNVIAVGDGSLLVKGDPDDIEQLKELIQQLDVPIPSVECRIEVVSVSAGKKNRNMLLQAMETGKCGTEIKAVSKTVGTAAQSSRLDVTIKATPLGGNEFEVETRWEASVPILGAQKGQLVRLEKTFSNTRRVKAGAIMMFGGVILKEEQGVSASGQEVLFFLTLKPF